MAKTAFECDGPTAEEARGWIVLMASDAMTAEELTAFKAWRSASPGNNAAFERERALWRDLRSVEPAFAERPASPARPLRRLRRPAMAVGSLALAACLVLAVFDPRLSVWIRADYQTGHTVQDITLPDGTQAMLDADSAIAVHYTAHERRVDLLRGEAWFDVTHNSDRPFRIAALGGITEDISTAFDVRRTADQVQVGVSSGMVQVAAPEGAPSGTTVREGERVSYTRNGPVLRNDAVNPDEIAVWRRGELVIDNATVAATVAQIARYRAAPVFLLGDVPAGRHISAVFRTDRPDEALDAVASMAKLRVFHLPGGVVVLRSGTR